MKYILTETEYQEILASKKQAHEFLTLKEQAHELLCKEVELADLETKFRVLKETQKIGASRLKLINQLMKKVRNLRAEYVCIAQNPKTGITREISAIVADTYRKFGWTVSEEFLVDRPA